MSPSEARTLLHGGEHPHLNPGVRETEGRSRGKERVVEGAAAASDEGSESAGQQEHSASGSSRIWNDFIMFLPVCCLESLQRGKVRRYSLFSPFFPS